MRIFKRLREMKEGHAQALEETQRVAEAAKRQEEVADQLLERAESQARSLKDHNELNHYSQGLTKSFRGRLA